SCRGTGPAWASIHQYGAASWSFGSWASARLSPRAYSATSAGGGRRWPKRSCPCKKSSGEKRAVNNAASTAGSPGADCEGDPGSVSPGDRNAWRNPHEILDSRNRRLAVAAARPVHLLQLLRDAGERTPAAIR